MTMMSKEIYENKCVCVKELESVRIKIEIKLARQLMSDICKRFLLANLMTLQCLSKYFFERKCNSILKRDS